MAHDHHHADANSYYVEQLFTIAVCGAIGAVAVLLYYSDRVVFLFGEINTVQHMRVLLGGLGLLALVLVRAGYVWFAVGEKKPADHHHHHDHDHAHDHAHGHDHHHHHHEHEHAVKAAPSPALTNRPVAHSHAHDHSHDHGHDHHHDHAHGHDDHDHGWAPWRFVLLLLPVILFLLGLPKAGFSNARALALEGEELRALQALGGSGGSKEVVPMTFLQLEKAAMNVNQREGLEGKNITVTGMYVGDDTNRFTLVRYKLNCCAADAQPLNAVIMINPADQEKYKLDPTQYQRKWVTVTGRVYFVQRRGTNEYLTAVFLYPSEEKPLSEIVKLVPADPNPWAN